MDGRLSLSREISCILCSKPIDLLSDLSEAETASPVQEECYAKRITEFLPQSPCRYNCRLISPRNAVLRIESDRP